MERPRILLIVAPSRPECIRTAQAFEIDVEAHLNQIRLICTLHGLLGWNEGTAFISLGRLFWPMPGRHPLYLALTSLERSGHFRAANDHDLAPLRFAGAERRPFLAGAFGW
ncbi:hypothetical protein N185_35500 [Sinorhizobium sp. GW3]|nr:hypothetical protein N185_35500 [Sinorhizobium sp. GW3]